MWARRASPSKPRALSQGDFADGACFVSCAPLRDPAQVASAIVDALGVSVLAGESPAQAAGRFLATKHLLLVTDNFEHVLAATPVVGALLAGCPHLTVLATSREPLALQAEQRQPVAPLAVPESGAPPEADAVTLFSERARARDPGFALDEATAAAVAQICRKVDGLPLAIELAAARSGTLSPVEIAERLDEALAAPGAGARDAAAHQQTLRATVDWSHALLDDDERACFARFAVFAGGATLHAMETVTGARLWTIDGLVTKNLLVRRRQPSGPTRLHMLETIRAYATDKLARAPTTTTSAERHYRHFLALAQRHGDERVLMDADCQGHIERLETEIDNLDAALAWALERRDAHAALRLCVALDHFWSMSMRYQEAINWIDRTLDLPGATADAALHVRALCSKGLALWPLRRSAEVRSTLTEAEHVARALGDPLILSQALQVRARLEATDDATADFAPSIAMADEAFQLAIAAGDAWATAKAAYATAIAADTIDDLHRCTSRAADLLAETGNVYHLARILAAGAYNGLLFGGSLADAKAYADRAAELLHELHDLQSRAFLLANIGVVAVTRRRHRHGRRRASPTAHARRRPPHCPLRARRPQGPRCRRRGPPARRPLRPPRWRRSSTGGHRRAPRPGGRHVPHGFLRPRTRAARRRPMGHRGARRRRLQPRGCDHLRAATPRPVDPGAVATGSHTGRTPRREAGPSPAPRRRARRDARAASP